MDLPPIALGWLRPALNVAAALTMAAPLATSAFSGELHHPQPLKDGSLLKEQTTQFVPEDHKGMVCMAIAPQCMTKKQWAAHCLSNKDGSANLVPNSKSKLIDSQSCKDAFDESAPNPEKN